MKTRYWIPILLLLALAVTYFTGPIIPTPEFGTELPRLSADLPTLARDLRAREATKPIRPDNQARIRFHAGRPERTEYAVVYLHGFGGSWRDGFPANAALADSLEANLYLGRWGNHGQNPPDHLADFSPDRAWNDAKEALAYGKRLGEKVVILSTSTGGTLALKLAAEFPDDIYALVNFSPNVKDDMPGSWMLNSPWGHELAQIVCLGDGDKEVHHPEPHAAQYYDTLIPADALVNLQVLVSTSMREETYRKITCPILTLYYYENWFKEDERVEIDVYPEVYAALATAENQRQLTALPTPKTHFLGSDIKSKDTEAPVVEALAFIRKLE